MHPVAEVRTCLGNYFPFQGFYIINILLNYNENRNKDISKTL